MEKSIFLFGRKPDRGPAEFRHHYINNHAKLGKGLTRCLQGYTVNLLEADGEPAAVTEHWVPKVMDLLTPTVAYASVNDFIDVFVDDQSQLSGFELYVLTQENVVVDGSIPSAALEQATPGVRVIERLADAADLPAPHPEAVRVVDNVVSHKLTMTEDYNWLKEKAEMAVVRMSWFDDAKAVGSAVGDGSLTQEYRFIAPAAWDAA